MVSIGDIPGLALVLIVTGVTLGLGVMILANFKDSTTSATANTTIDNAVSGISELGSWLETIALVKENRRNSTNPSRSGGGNHNRAGPLVPWSEDVDTC